MRGLGGSIKTCGTSLAAVLASTSPVFEKQVAKLVSSSILNFKHAFEGPRRDSLILLLTTACIVPIMTRLKSSPILGFLAIGTVLGPHGFSLVKDLKTTEVGTSHLPLRAT